LGFAWSARSKELSIRPNKGDAPADAGKDGLSLRVKAYQALNAFCAL
jgi:hypothetical protein